MAKRTISKHARNELIEALRQRYKEAAKADKTRILDEFVAVAGYHRKHAVRLLGGQNGEGSRDPTYSRRIYDEAVKEALIVTWEAADRICGKRLQAILPNLVAAMERHGHLELDPEVRRLLLSVSAATIDRLLKPVRSKARPRKNRHSKPKVSRQIPIRTFSDWDIPPPGYFEIDFVVHSGNSMAGSFIHTLAATDVCSGWTESIPLLAREQSLVVEGLEVIRRQLPFPILGIDSDNDSAFINDTLLAYSKDQNIEFTRSRAYRKNDQGYIEQKNGAVIRRFVGYDRYSGIVAGQALAHLYQAIRLYVNNFQPSFKLREKSREGSRVRRSYHKPTTPCDRLLSHPGIGIETKQKLRLYRRRLDPVRLLHQIRNDQAALVALASPEDATGAQRKSLDQFLSQLPSLWRSGEARPTHRKPATKPRYWRTRKDPFEAVWPEILRWLQAEPDVTATALLERLQKEYPDSFINGQLRTLQRRVREWRQTMAKKLVYACLDGDSHHVEIPPVGPDAGKNVH
jgi:hypothetical protein